MSGWRSTAGGEERNREQRERRSTGRVVGAVFLMTISWAVSPHPHRVAHFKYLEIVTAVAASVCVVLLCSCARARECGV